MKITQGVEEELYELFFPDKEPKDKIKEIDQQNRERLLNCGNHEIVERTRKALVVMEYQEKTGTIDNRYRELRAEIQLLLNYLDTYTR